jgi:hypothetical protein
MNKQLKISIKAVAIIGNILLVVWILFNGMDSGWSATPVQLVAYSSLVILLGLNTYIVSRSK